MPRNYKLKVEGALDRWFNTYDSAAAQLGSEFNGRDIPKVLNQIAEAMASLSQKHGLDTIDDEQIRELSDYLIAFYDKHGQTPMAVALMLTVASAIIQSRFNRSGFGKGDNN